MKKQYINAFVIILIIVLFTNTDFYKKHVLGIDPNVIVQKNSTSVTTDKKSDIVQDVLERSIKKIDQENTLLSQSTVLLDSNIVDTLNTDKILKERKVLLSTKKLNLEFSSKGAIISKVTLNNYYDSSRVPLVLFNSKTINSVEVNKLSDAEVIYSLNRTDSILNLTKLDSLVFEYKSSNLEIVKTYIIDPSSSMINVKLSIINNDFINSYSVNWDSPVIFNDREDGNHAAVISYLNDEYDDNNDETITTPFSNINNFWVGYRTKYFFGSMVFSSPKSLDGNITSMSKMPKDHKSVKGYFSVSFTTEEDSKELHTEYQILFSPINKKILEQYGNHLDKAAQFGWTLIKPVSDGIMFILTFMNKFISNWGVIIVIFSLMLKFLLYPLNKKTIQSSKKMQDIQPLIQEINKKYAKDPQKKQVEIMNLYKQKGVNPFGSCLPMLVQMPIFFAMYAVFRGAIEFRQAPFFGWITDLSQPESIFAVEMFGFTFHFGILVLISSIGMFLQMKMTMKDPKQKAMPYMMGIGMFFMFSTMSAGLNLYWATFNLFQLVQQILVERKS